ncbi:hypothetical protein QBC44DRAFT_386690 [Cladorrhinum sp. PSN332]|nr:hypothetical protein QBC44DRAFT_386690 [Cladorrhinum sp. PSN332]
MKFSCSLISAILALSVSAIPAPQNQANGSTTSVAAVATASSTAASAVSKTTTSAAAAATSTEAGAGAGAEEGEGEGEENEIEQQGAFGRAIALGGGDVKIDTLFPPTDQGGFEVEFQNGAARTLTVVQNQNPAGAAPDGFDFLEPVSYSVRLRGGTRNLTLQKIDWIRSEASTLDISQGKIGKLCSETNTFVISDSLGELEFEAEENELTLTVSSLNGQWAVFLPKAGAAAGANNGAAETATGGGAASESCGAGTLCRSLLDTLARFSGGATKA